MRLYFESSQRQYTTHALHNNQARHSYSVDSSLSVDHAFVDQTLCSKWQREGQTWSNLTSDTKSINKNVDSVRF